MQSVDRDQSARPSKLVEFCCVAPGHWKEPGAVERTDTLTITQGGWAFCPLNALGDGHEWAATGGIAADQLRRMVRRGSPTGFEFTATPAKRNGKTRTNGASRPNGSATSRKKPRN